MATRGLTAEDALDRLRRDGPNVLAPPARSQRMRAIIGPLADPMILLLVVAAVTYFFIGDTRDGIVAIVALVPVAAVGWLLEVRASSALRQLRLQTAPVARVRRDGHAILVPAEDIVRGDVLLVREGDVIPADATVLELTQLLANEAALTGESEPVSKATGTGPASSIFAGTSIVSGSAVTLVTATGPRTRFGQIASLVAASRPPATPLQRAIRRLLRVFGAAAAGLTLVAMAAELLRGHGWSQAVIAGVSLALAAIPEEFPLVYTLYLSLGAWRLARDRALVRQLAGVETLGSTTVICTDKTGTLTEGRVAVSALVPLVGSETTVLEAALFACEPDPFDPLEIALSRHAESIGVSRRGSTLVEDYAFDPVDRYLTHVWRRSDGTCVAGAKGAFEGLARHADAALPVIAEQEHRELVARGLRVLAVAAGELDDEPTGDREHDETTLELIGLIGFSDPVRDGVAQALDECRAAGVRVIVITGDHPETAHAVVESLGLPHQSDVGGDLIATGDEIDAASDEELAHLAATVNVFARTRADQKHRLVRSLRGLGEVVAMTGDGINDAPALREANVGIAMGERGTAVAREASTIVLLDDNFATIVRAVRNARRIAANLAHAFAYLLAFHPPLLIAAVAIPLIGRPLLLLPVHLVLLELIVHPVVSIVFEADPPAPDVMQQPPSKPTELLAPRRLLRPVILGSALGAAVVVLYVGALSRGWPVREARALSFAALLGAQPFLVALNRTADRTRRMGVMMLILVALPFAVVYTPALRTLLELARFPVTAWLAVAAVIVVTIAASGALSITAARTTRDRDGGSGG